MNMIKTTMLMALMMILLVVLGGVVGGKGGALLMFVISLAMNFFSYWFSDSIVLKMYGARPLTESDAPELYRLVADLAARASLPMPKVCLIESQTPNAFATGRDPSHAAVAVTRGIVGVLSREELSGVLAHELSHIKHRDTLISTIAAAMGSAISMLAYMAQWSAIFGRSDDDEGAGGIVGTLLAVLVAPLAATIIQLAISRSREYDADKAGGEICGNPRYLARALEKISSAAQALPPMREAEARPATSNLFIINPLAGSRQAFMSLFSTHPPTAERIQRLEEQARLLGR
ncbi:zinc metalloprotease HtpX [uncultured Selenomonas sp.]|uniref:zinc metalloprotease HtpX n=1 Tax=uncultured Selenomonas sp. TaxID=159275 RepID=UPI0028DC3C2A|nr:zinc metalloprotease HtpX [uncultured Selenomonas sp.]